MEFAGAFGDFGTLVPFILVYITILKLNPVGVLFCFGIANIIVGLHFKTPIPIQPMKAIGTVVATRAGEITSGMLWGAGLFTGIAWIILSFSGLASYITKLVKQPVVKGILLGLGFSFMVQGFKQMYSFPLVAAIGFLLVFTFRKNSKMPIILMLLILGFITALIEKPSLLSDLSNIRPSFDFSFFQAKPFTFSEFIKGVFILGLPQIPLTIGNGVIALVEENNRLFPKRPVSIRKISLSTGLLNLFPPFLGGVPMCHGAGGMAGHVRFGARTGGTTIILGFILLSLALFFGDSLSLIFQLVPHSVLGIILFLTGLELARPSIEPKMEKPNLVVMLVTAGVAFINAGVALLVGIVLSWLLKGKSQEVAEKAE